MIANVGRSNVIWFLYDRVCQKRPVIFTLLLMLLSLGLPLLLTWREGVLFSGGETKVGYLNDLPAIFGVGFGLPLICLCVVLYCRRFQHGFQLLHEKQTIQANPDEVASVITDHTEKLNSPYLNWIIPVSLLCNMVWIFPNQHAAKCVWFYCCSNLPLYRYLNIPGWYYVFLVTLVLYAYFSIMQLQF